MSKNRPAKEGEIVFCKRSARMLYVIRELPFSLKLIDLPKTNCLH